MSDTGTIMNKDEQYEVIDECTGEKTPETVESARTEGVKDSCPKTDNTTQKQELETNTSNTNSCDNNTDKPVPMEVECAQGLNNDATNVTADISSDQTDTHKDVTDEDVMHHLDVIENIELDPETFGVDQSMKEVSPSESSVIGKEEQEEEEITVIGERTEQKWYEEKIAEKEALLRERLSKLARVLSVSYPSYEKWLERIEKIEGSPMCKIDPPRRCSLTKPYTNRWKFLCSKKHVPIPIKEEDNPGSSSKKCFKVVWCLEPMGAGGVNTDNLAEFPSFVLNAVKIFEDFLQTTIPRQDAITFNENPDDTSMDDSKKATATVAGQCNKKEWSWLLVRCNSKDELMLFATGKNINHTTMNRLKQIYESGTGKNCNVKSLYCKSINKYDDSAVTTFLTGVQALNEVVGNLKVQLTPKTNFWSNAAGAWNVAKTVTDMLKPTQKTTVLEVGCGIGVIGLTIATKCREVIGIDSPSEIEEAKITCNLNNVYNVSFIAGSAFEVVNKLNAARDLHNKNRVTYSIINANTNMGRAIEVMTALRKITSLRRIVMVTALTKQSVRAILELARPIEGEFNPACHPFMPVRACVVDILPNGSHFEAVILMERRFMHRLTQPWFLKMLEEESKSLDNTKELEKKIIINDGTESADVQLRKNPLAKVELAKKSKLLVSKKAPFAKSDSDSPVKGKIKLKRDHSPEIIEIPKKVKKFEKPGFKPWQQDAAKKKNWLNDNSALRINPLFERKTKENKEQVDLRKKLSSNRIDADLIQKVNESRDILEAAKEKLSGPSPTVDPTTAKEIKNVLSLVLDQTNKLQNQLPRSVWDRIAPPETDQLQKIKKELEDDPLLKGRFVQETRAQDIVITAPNKEYLEIEDLKPKFKKYQNLAPLEPDTVMPMSMKLTGNRGRQQNQDFNSWNRNKNFDKNRWNDAGSRKPSPMRRQDLSFKHRASPSNRFSPKRPLLSPPRRPCSPPRRHLPPDRPYEVDDSPSHREYSPQRRAPSPHLRHMASSSGGRIQVSPPRRPFSSPNRAPVSPPGRPMSPTRRSMTGRMSPIVRCHISPPRSQMSPPRRQMSPVGLYDSNQLSPVRRPISPMRRPMSPMGHQMSTDRRPVSPVGRMMSPPRSRDMMPPPSRHHSPNMRRFSPPRCQQSPPRHQSPPSNRFADEWDIPSRGAIEQSSTWQRSINDRSENVWRNERQSTNWQGSSNNDRYSKPANQEKSWDSSSFHGNSWGPKQSLAKSGMKEPWKVSDNRWSGGSSRSGTSGETWNRNKESLGGRGKEPWMMNADKPRGSTSSWDQSNDSWNQGDKDEWNDLPEDARDPWGDEGNNLGMKERWMNLDNQMASSSGWSREADKGDQWAKPKDNWQNKSQAFPTKPGQNSGNPNVNESRWLPLNDASKKVPLSSNWQGGNNVAAWQPSNYNFSSQSQSRSFMTNRR